MKSLSPTDRPLDVQKKLIAAKMKWNDQQKKNYFMFQLNDEGAKRMSMVCKQKQRNGKRSRKQTKNERNERSKRMEERRNERQER